MATYYVDYVGGADTNNGTGTATAWQHCPGDDAATDTAAIGDIGATDTLLFKGGVIYILETAHGIDILASRYSNGATIKSGHLHTTPWGTGRAVIDGNDADTDATYLMQIYNRSNITVEGFEMRDIDIDGFGSGAVYINTCTGCLFKNNIVHNVGGAAWQMVAIEVARAIETTDDGNIIESCTIYDSTEKGIELYRSGGNIVRDNLVYNHCDHGIQITSQYNLVYRNIIHHVPAAVKGKAAAEPGFAFKTSSSTMTVGHNDIYNNIIYACGGVLNINCVGAIDLDNTHFYHNTAYDCGNDTASGNGFLYFRVDSTGRINNTEIRNNIFSTIASQGGRYTAMRTYSVNLGNNNVISYNLWFMSGQTLVSTTNVGETVRFPTLIDFADGGSVAPDYRFCRVELGTGNSFDNDPTQIFNEDPLMTNPAAQDFTIPTGSPAKDTGANVGITSDYLGLIRPAGAGYDIGAYEFGAVAGPYVRFY